MTNSYFSIPTLATLGDRSFTAVAQKIWDDLPEVIRNAINVVAFKRLLKTHLFSQGGVSLLED